MIDSPKFYPTKICAIWYISSFSIVYILVRTFINRSVNLCAIFIKYVEETFYLTCFLIKFLVSSSMKRFLPLMLSQLEVSCKHWPGYVNWGTLSDHVMIICQTAQVVQYQTKSANSHPDLNFL